MNLNQQNITALPFRQNDQYNDGLGYYFYLKALISTVSPSDKAMYIRRSLENLVYVYYKRECLNWPEALKRSDTLANRIKYVTPKGVYPNSSNPTYNSSNVHWLPDTVIKYDSIDNTLLCISKILNPSIHTGNDNLLPSEFETALFLLERFIAWYFMKYNIDISLYNITLKRLHDWKENQSDQRDCFHITPEYWRDLSEKSIPLKDNIFKNFFLRTDETLTHEIIAIEANESIENGESFQQKIVEVSGRNDKENRTEKIGDVIDSYLSLNCSVLLKIFASSGEGKSVFLSQIAFEYSRLHQKYKVYYISYVTLETITFIKTEIKTTSLPLLFILDTPSKYSDILNESFSLVCEKNYKPFVMIIADQEGRFNHKLTGKSWDAKFENYFSEVYRIDFELTENEKQNIYNRIVDILKKDQNFNAEKEITIKGIFNNSLQLTIREQIYRITKYLEKNITTKHIQDWDAWEQLTNEDSTKKFRNLFPFVALFSFFEIPVPISIFNFDYLAQVTEVEVENFISIQSNNSIIKIKNNSLELRHEQIPLWYFEIDEHIKLREKVLKKFLNDFQRELDPDGCYLFRNIHSLLEKVNLLGDFSGSERKRILINYFNKVGLIDPAFPKVITEIAKLEEKQKDKIIWLDKVIEAEASNIHARIFKAQLLIADAQYDSAQKIIDEVNKISETVSRALNNQFNLDLRSNKPYTSEKYIALAQGKKDFYNALCELAKRMRFVKEAIPIALEILIHLKNIEPENPLASMAIAHIYRGEKSILARANAILELKSILAFNNKYIPARLLLADMYIHNNQIDKAEDILQEGIKLKSDQAALYIRVIKLYRDKKYLIKDAVEKASEILRKGLEVQSFGLQVQIRTEYGKWCYENFDTIDQHQRAIDFFKDTIKLYPQHLHSRTELGIIYQKSKFFRDLNKALSILREGVAIDIKEKEIPIRVVLASTLMHIDTQNSWMEAKEILEHIRYINPNNQATYLGLIKVYQHFQDQEKLQGAINAIEISTQKMGITFNSYVQQLLKSGKNEEALGVLKYALREDGDNYFFLNQVAKVLINQASKETVSNIDFKPLNQQRNGILLLAVEYLLKSNSILGSNQHTLYLIIQAYDGFKYHKIQEAKEYKRAVTLRNERLEELYQVNKNNPYLINALSLICRFSWRPILAVFFLENCDSSTYTIEQKLKLLIYLKGIHKLFNNVKRIEEITKQFNEIAKNGTSFEKLLKSFNKEMFLERNNYRLVKVFNEGFLAYPFESVTSNGVIIPIVSKEKKINNQIKSSQRVYFATYEIDNIIFANNIEPYFDKFSITNLNSILSNELGCLRY